MQPESLMMTFGYKTSLSEGAIKCPLFQTSTFVFESAQKGKEHFELAYGLREPKDGEEQGLIYVSARLSQSTHTVLYVRHKRGSNTQPSHINKQSRLNNPDMEILEDRLAVWDNAEACVSFASGLAGITTTILAYTKPGDCIIYTEPLYGGTHHFLEHELKKWDVHAIAIPAGVRLTSKHEKRVREQMDGRALALALVETPANPTNRLVDLADVSNMIAHLTADQDPKRRVPLCVDNTFLGPLFMHPLEHGADIVLYSATKFIGGHSDVVAGAALGDADVLMPIRTLRTFLGNMLSPMDGWLLMRSLETLKMRMSISQQNARVVAQWLKDHPAVTHVHYLDLIPANHPMRDVYDRQCLGSGSLIAFEVRGGESGAFACMDRMQLIKTAVSLGGTESLVEHPASMTHAGMSTEDKARLGVTSGLIRFSVGVECVDDILADLSNALAHL